jgi:hypothetical protein
MSKPDHSLDRPMSLWRALGLLLVSGAGLVTLLGSGGGGGAGGDVTAPYIPVKPDSPPGFDSCSSTADSFGIVLSPAPLGKSVGLAVASCNGAISSPQWTQTAGPAVTLLAGKSQTIAFEPTQAGAYSFNVSFKDASGAARTSTSTVNVTASTLAATQLILRGHQSVRKGGKVSVRAWPTVAGNDAVANITWTQVAGPPVTLDTTDFYVARFTAPEVASDAVIRLRAVLTTQNGASDSIEALVLVEPYAAAPAGNNSYLWTDSHVSRVYAYRPTSPYAAALAPCVYDAQQTSSNLCALSRLPFLAQEAPGGIPSIDQVMNRVVVSHDWMGKNFEDFLRAHDTRGDFRRMLSSVTAIVIGSHVRPSFYYAGTGAIYLDAENFWLTPAERDTVNEAPDFRSAFGKDLQFTSPWRYTKDNASIFGTFSRRARVARAQDQLLRETAWLLYHELGHALDFLPPQQYTSLDNNRSAWSNMATRVNAAQLTSDVVTNQYPLTSTIMSGLGQVQYQGATATAAQIAYTPLEVAGFFSRDLATDDYAYSTRREDTAMLLEEFMMSSRLSIRRDFAFADKPADSATTSANLVVRWGQRGRAGEVSIKPRLRQVVSQLVPWMPLAEVDNLAAPLSMRNGESWSANLALPAPPPGGLSKQAQAQADGSPFMTAVQQQQRHGHGAGFRPNLP